MTKLSCFALFKEALAFTGNHFGTLCRWMIPPMLLCVAAALPAVLLHMLKNVWVLYIPAGIFCLFAWIPYCLRLNQLAVLGEVEPGGYVEKIFTGKSVRFVLYMVFLTLLVCVGVLMAFLPWLVSIRGVSEGLGGMIGAGVVSFALLAFFLVLTVPMHLIFPATAVEPRPALGQMFALAEGNRLRLLLTLVLSLAVFTLINLLVEALGGLISPKAAESTNLFMAPLRITISWVDSIVSSAICAVAYRKLRGLPDPAEPVPAEPVPAEPAPATPASEAQPVAKLEGGSDGA